MNLPKLQKLKPENRILQVLLVILLILAVFLAAEFIHSQQMRQEMINSRNRSYFVTNMSCGYGVNETGDPVYNSCPENLGGCFELEGYDSPRCVKDGFTENYCGNHTTSIIEQSRPAGMKCIFKENFKNQVIEDIQPVPRIIADFFDRIDYFVSFLWSQIDIMLFELGF